VAATDQTTEAIIRHFRLRRRQPLGKALEAIPVLLVQKKLQAWNEAAIVADVRDARVRATHHHYVKTPSGSRYEVQLPERACPYGGSRALADYAQAAITHLQDLRPIIGDLREVLSSP